MAGETADRGRHLYRMEKVNPLQGVVEFVASVDSGSFSAASRKLGVSVAHVSRQVAELERRMGLQLLQRTSRHSAPTEAGSRVHARCRDLLDGLERQGKRSRTSRTCSRATCVSAVGGHFAEDHLNPVLLRFVAAHPGIRLDTEVRRRSVDLVDEGFDLAVRAGRRSSHRASSATANAVPRPDARSASVAEGLGHTPEHPDELDPLQCLSLGGRPWKFHLGQENRSFAPQGRIVSNGGSTLIKAAVAELVMVQLPDTMGL